MSKNKSTKKPKPKEITNLPRSKDVDSDWPKEGRDYREVDGQFYWSHETIPIKAFSRDRMKKRSDEQMKKSKMGYAGGMKTKMMGSGKKTKMPMVEKDGQMVPAFAADGKGKMAESGKIRMSTKMMANGGPTGAHKRDMDKSGMARGSGAARPQPFRKNG